MCIRDSYGFALLPAVVMIVMPMTALVMMVQQYGMDTLIGGVATVMFVLGTFLMVMSWRSLLGKKSAPETVANA